MASVQEALVTYLEAQVSDAGKGYPNLVPGDGPYPAWTYQVINDEQLIAHGGGTGLYFARIQIDMMAAKTTTAGAYELAAGYAAQMRVKLDGYRGAMGSIVVHFCKTAISDDYGELHELPAVRFDVMINYRLS